MNATVRITIKNETNSGNRRGWSKLVTSVDATKTNGYALAGPFLNDGTETDVPVGSVIVQQHPEGSVKHSFNSGHCYVVGSDGELYTTGVNAANWHKNFLSFRDGVVKVLSNPFDYLPVAAGGSPDKEVPPPAADTPSDPRTDAIETIRRLMSEHGITVGDLN
jgi:hypothetical protein